jgi:hypothetical protein
MMPSGRPYEAARLWTHQSGASWSPPLRAELSIWRRKGMMDRPGRLQRLNHDLRQPLYEFLQIAGRIRIEQRQRDRGRNDHFVTSILDVQPKAGIPRRGCVRDIGSSEDDHCIGHAGLRRR